MLTKKLLMLTKKLLMLTKKLLMLKIYPKMDVSGIVFSKISMKYR